jgi:glucose/arabinose dehydrogenase
MARTPIPMLFVAACAGAAIPVASTESPAPVPVVRAPPTCMVASGLVLPEGFCALVVASDLGHVRQITLSPSGDLYAAIAGGGVTALRDTNGDGEADVVRHFGDDGGTGILWHRGDLWFGADSKVLRWSLPDGVLVPEGEPAVVVEGLPTNGHRAKTLVRLGGDTLIVNIGSQTNSCQESDRGARSPGQDPCRELETRAGLWRFSAGRLHQHQDDGSRYATGLRNAMALAVQPGTGKLYAAPHGRDQLGANWGFSDAQNAELPAEELLQLEPGDNAGWPYCYFDWQQGLKVLAPEYGGDGRAVGRCARMKAPVLGFPGHWAPMAMAFYRGTQFPAKYRGGAFVAFHGSWNRAPLPQAGYRIEFVPFANGRPTGKHEVFATGAGGTTSLRAAGVAVGPDGSLYIAGENSGTIWRIMAQP